MSVATAVLNLGDRLLPRALPEPATVAALALLRRACGLKRRSVCIDGLNMVYLEGGSGPPLVLLHGIGADKDNFLLVCRLLVRYYRVIVPDLPGFGESDVPADRQLDIHTQVRHLDRFASRLGLGQFHLGGNSMGGLIAGAYAAIHQERVLSLWLLAPAGVKSARPSELMMTLDADGHPPIFARSTREMRALLRFVMHRPLWMPRFMLAPMVARQRATYTLNRALAVELVNGASLEELFAERPELPTLIVWGQQDRAVDVSGARILHELLPRSELAILPNVGHVPMIERPFRVARDYLRFRNRLKSARSRSTSQVTIA